jgi:type I restriction enzyme S subunit
MNEDDEFDKFADAESAELAEPNGIDEWNKSKLENLLSDLLTGGRPTGGGLDEGEYISIGGTQVESEGYLNLTDLVYIPEDYFQKVEETQLQKHDILVVKDGANTGDIAIAWESNENVVTNEHLFTLRPRSDLNSPYLFYYLLSHKGWKQINGTITGSAQEGINRGFVGKVDIEYPPLPEQRKIATILYTVDKAIEKTEKIIEQTERVQKGIRQDVFSYGIDESGRLRSQDDQLEETYLGRFPSEWKLTTCGC